MPKKSKIGVKLESKTKIFIAKTIGKREVNASRIIRKSLNFVKSLNIAAAYLGWAHFISIPDFEAS